MLVHISIPINKACLKNNNMVLHVFSFISQFLPYIIDVTAIKMTNGPVKAHLIWIVLLVGCPVAWSVWTPGAQVAGFTYHYYTQI